MIIDVGRMEKCWGKLFDERKELLGDLEGFVCHVNPEIVVLLLVMVGSWSVANDAETYERYVVDVASLSNSY